MTPQQFEQETITRAQAGDRDAAIEALRLCSDALRHKKLSASLADYLADRLDALETAIAEVQELRKVGKKSAVNAAFGTAVADALLVNRRPGRPKDPLPAWKVPYAAFGTLLLKAKVRKAQVTAAMDEARVRTEGKNLERTTAEEILKAHKPMLDLDEERLLHLAGDLRKILSDFLPQT